jgi:hypothetical protein
MLSLRTLLRSLSDSILRDEFNNPKGLGLPKLPCCPRVWALPCPKSATHRSIVSVAVVPSAHRGVGWGNWATRTVRSKALRTLKKYICVQLFLQVRIKVVLSDSLEHGRHSILSRRRRKWEPKEIKKNPNFPFPKSPK